jgi:hypothetical protein
METALELIGLIYDSAADASRWQAFLESFPKATRAKYVSLIIGDPRFDEFAFACRYGMSDEDLRQYLLLFDETDPLYAVTRRSPEGTVGGSHEFWDERKMVETAMYQQFLKPRDWYYGMAGIFWVTETSRSVIALFRTKAEGPCEEPEQSLLRVLVPHLRRAAKLHGELTSLRSQRSAFTDHLDRYPQAFILPDAQGRILFSERGGHKNHKLAGWSKKRRRPIIGAILSGECRAP